MLNESAFAQASVSNNTVVAYHPKICFKKNDSGRKRYYYCMKQDRSLDVDMAIAHLQNTVRDERGLNGSDRHLLLLLQL